MKKMPPAARKTKPARKKNPQLPGKREYQLLEILWQHHPLTVAQLRRFLPPAAPLAYTTVMTLLKRIGHDHQDQIVAYLQQNHQSRL